MKKPTLQPTAGTVLLMSLGTIVIVSAIAATVLSNVTTRYNVSNGQVRAWKQALHAAETAGDIAYAEVRKTALDPTYAFTGWTKVGNTYTSPVTRFGNDNLAASSTVDLFYYDNVTGNPWYRIRAKGTAPMRGLKRTGMDDRVGPATRGDSLLRKIDINFDHFIAAYGPSGDGIGKAIVKVASPQISRRIELIASPITPFEAAIKSATTFYGLGNAAYIDSYDSANGAYYFAADNPGDPHYADSRSGSVEIGSNVATIRGMVYGDLATDGGTIVRSQYITGTIDNTVPFTLEKYKLPLMPVSQPSPTSANGTTNINPPAAGTPIQPTYYQLSSFPAGGKLTINRYQSAETYVAVRVTNDLLGSITIKPGVHAEFFVDGNISIKARDLTNETGRAGNLQIYCISPNNTAQTINVDPPGNFAAAIYAPTADFTMNGNPDITGAIVVKSFYGNGNTSWHYDRSLDSLGEVTDYRIASYVEDVR